MKKILVICCSLLLVFAFTLTLASCKDNPDTEGTKNDTNGQQEENSENNLIFESESFDFAEPTDEEYNEEITDDWMVDIPPIDPTE